MSLETLFSKVKTVAQTRHEKTEAQYRQLVRMCAEGRDVSPEKVVAFLDETGRDVEQFQADVENTAKRIEWRKQVDSLPALEDEKAKCEEQLAKFDAELARVTESIQERAHPIRAKLARIVTDMGAASEARMQLARTNEVPELLQRRAAIAKEHAAAAKAADEVRQRLTVFAPYLGDAPIPGDGKIDFATAKKQAAERVPILKEELARHEAQKARLAAELDQVEAEAIAV